jgi:DNA-binding beta-propeller fold protein YncE
MRLLPASVLAALCAASGGIVNLQPTDAAVSRVAGGSSGSSNGVGAAAQFLTPNSVVVTAAGDFAYIADAGNFVIRKLDIATATVTTLAAGVLGGGGCSDGVGPSSSSFTSLRSLALDGRPFGVTASVVHPGSTVTELVPNMAGRPAAESMQASEVAAVIALMAALPDETNLFEATILPIAQPFMGRG